MAQDRHPIRRNFRLGIQRGGVALISILGYPGCAQEPGDGSRKQELVVYAAASLTEVVGQVADLFAIEEKERSSDVLEIVTNFAGSNTLALQIDASPKADVFLSADPRWVDKLEDNRRVLPDSRRDFLSNRLCVVGRTDCPVPISSPKDLLDPRIRHLSLADPVAVPAGRYARKFLEAVSVDGSTLWQNLQGKLAPALDVRAAMTVVESDPEIVGIVYETDALTSSRVKILFEVPLELQPHITYCAIAVQGRPDPALGLRFLDFLSSDGARDVFRDHGFLPISEPSR